jgi:hypothetical protein
VSILSQLSFLDLEIQKLSESGRLDEELTRVGDTIVRIKLYMLKEMIYFVISYQ